MLVLTRKKFERLILRALPGYAGEPIVLTQLEIRGDRSRWGIKAPPSIEVTREELDEGEPVDAAHARAQQERARLIGAGGLAANV